MTWTESSKTPDADGVFSKAPIFNFNDDKLKFDTNDVSNANDNYGSASAFAPKYLIYTKGILLRIPFAFIVQLNESIRQAFYRFHR